MAGGNLGDLSMTLTLKTRMEEESKKLINALNKIDVTGKRAQDALNLITEATSTLSSKGVADIKKLQDAIKPYDRDFNFKFVDDKTGKTSRNVNLRIEVDDVSEEILLHYDFK